MLQHAAGLHSFLLLNLGDSFYYYFLKFCLFDTRRERTQAGRVGEGEAVYPLSRGAEKGAPMQGLIGGPWDHGLSHSDAPYSPLFSVYSN